MIKLAFISTYPPRKCGIGTFTKNLYHSVVNKEGQEDKQIDGFIVALNDHGQKYDYPKEVKYTIRQEHQRDYLKAAKSINISGADVCILEHEYGIFGGRDGVYILPLLHRLEIPFIVTLHTVLKNPSYNEKLILKEICKMAYKVVVMSKKAIEFLTTIYEVPEEKIAFIEHGVPDLKFSRELTKSEFKLEDRKILMTFGFLSRNKGIETVIKALPKVVKEHPEVLYMVLGKTHPNVIRHDGEEYRNYLLRLVKELNLEDHVFFLNEHMTQKELFKYLSAADIYITPYLNEAQITSGTLSYAIGVGTGVISTPYWHAAELLADGRGRLFDFGDYKGLAYILNDLLGHPEKLNELRRSAWEYGHKITWPKIGEQYAHLFREIKDKGIKITPRRETVVDPFLLPPFSLAHVQRLTDDTGILQHAKYGIPNLKEGYCLDDNARALLMVLKAYQQKKDPVALELLPVYLSYIHYMQNSDGSFRNFLSFNRNYLDKKGSEDAFGRAIWALGYLIRYAPKDAYYQTGIEIFSKAYPHFEELESIRGISNTILGICHYLQHRPSDENMISVLRNISCKLLADYDKHKTPEWRWFEPVLTYDNGLMPHALLHAAEVLKDENLKKAGIESMDFLTDVTFREEYLSIIGNEKWYHRGEERSEFAQQPIDAMAMVLMYYQAYLLTKDNIYLDKLYKSFMWFLGDNELRLTLFDFETKGCCDALEKDGINRNQGAESTLSYLISHLTVLEAFEESYIKN